MAKKSTTTKKKTAAESKTPAKGQKGVEIGRSGTNIFSGIISEEYLAELSGTRAMKVYDEMRRSDATVRAALTAVQLPIRRAQWFVNPASDEDADKEVADFVERALFDLMSITWDDFLRQALLNTTYGVMVFEKVFEAKEVDGATRVVWGKFAPRLPRSITAWQMSNGESGISQVTPEGGTAEIPMEKLLIFTNEKEGDNWWGVSMLRSAYKHWYIKSNLEKIDAIAHERQGLGLPFVKLGQSATAEDRQQAETILGNMRAHEQGYLVEPDSMAVEFKDMKASSTKDASRAIDYHDRLITKAVLAQFLNLGSGASGSYALSQDHSALFLQSLEAIANGIVDTINKYAIPQLVDLNFTVKEYPKLDYSGISRTDVDGISTAYQRLVQSGGIKPIEEDEAYLRKTLGLPDKPKEENTEEPEDEATIEDVNEELGLPATEPKKKVESSDIEAAVSKRLSEFKSRAAQMDFLETQITRVRTLTAKHPNMVPVERALSAAFSDLKRRVFQEENNFKSWRTLTFAEKKVNFESLQTFIDKTEAGLIDDANAVLKKSTEEYMRKLTKYVNDNDRQGVKDLEMPYWNEYKAVMKEYLKRTFDFGKNNSAREMGVKAPATPNDTLTTLDLLAETIATNHHYEIENEAKLAIANQLAKFSDFLAGKKVHFGEKEIKALAKAAVAIATSQDSLVRNAAAVMVAATINQGRKLVFDKNKSKIHALQRSEILDSVTCNFCLSMDGRIVEPDDSIAQEGTFHSNCRGIWVEILKDEEELPEVTGVPNSLRDRLGDAVNELVQPKKPIVRKDSLAAKAIAKGKAGPQDDEDVEASELKATDPKQHVGCGGHIHT